MIFKNQSSILEEIARSDCKGVLSEEGSKRENNM
jgi:hypothetical protein